MKIGEQDGTDGTPKVLEGIMTSRTINVRSDVYEALKAMKGERSFSDFFEESFAIGFEKFDIWGVLSMKSGESGNISFLNSKARIATLERLSKLQRVKEFFVETVTESVDGEGAGVFVITIP